MRTLPQSFVGGELSPRMFGRPDDPKYQRGAARLRGFLVEPSGAVRTGPGTQFVRAARNHAQRCRLVPYRASGGETLHLELGFRQEYPSSTVPGYLRIHRLGATLLHSTAWSATTTYATSDLVTRLGVLYRAKQASTNETPPNATYWEPLEHVGQQDFLPAAVSLTTFKITFGAPHGLSDGEPVEFTNAGGSLPVYQDGLVLVSIGAAPMYAIVTSSTEIRLSKVPGGSYVVILTSGTGTHRIHRRYTQGDLVSKSGSVYYCRTTRPIDGTGADVLPGTEEVYWYAEPATGEYELPTTLAITADELFEATYSQQGSVMTLCAPRSYPCELQPTTNPHGFDVYTIWTWQQVIFAPPLPAPTGVVATATKRGATLEIASLVGVGGGGTRLAVNTTTEHRLTPGLDYVLIENSADSTLNNKWWGVEAGSTAQMFVPVNPDTGQYVTFSTATGGGSVRPGKLNTDTNNSYVVTAIDSSDRESQGSSPASVTNNLYVTGAYNTITWTAVAGAVRYRVYKLRADTGLYGFIGEASTPSFRDDTIAPDPGQTPPLVDDTLASAPDHTTSAAAGLRTLPRAVAHYDGRRVFGGTEDGPQDVWLVRSNSETDLSYSIPVKATDRIHQRIKGTRAGTIRHLVSLGRLHALTDTTEFVVMPVDTESLTPDSFAARAQSYVGAAKVQCEIMGTVLLFAGAKGGHLYEMAFTEEGGGYVPVDLCERAVHLFDGMSLGQLAAQTSPLPIAWCTSSSGLLLGLTRVPRQEVLAWHRRATDGVFESVSSGLEEGEDRVYVVVQRTINGSTVRYIERFAPLAPQALVDTWQVDCGLRLVTNTSVSTVTGLSHLEGKEVAVLANGMVQARRTVSGGLIQLATPLPAGSNKVLVGLPITAELQTVPATFALEAYGLGRPKNIGKVWVRVDASGSFEVGPSLTNMVRVEVTPGTTFSGEVTVRVPPTWAADGQIFVRQADPLPLTVVSITADVEVAG